MRLYTDIKAGMMITACPSEPILALAAAIAMNRAPDNQRELTKALIEFVSKYRVHRGLEGELYSRLVLMMARDLATLPADSKTEVANPYVQDTNNGLALCTVTLNGFLEALLWKDAIPDRYAVKWRDVLLDVKDVHITFTHFLELEVDVAVLESRWCFDTLCRGAAVQCTFGQPVIDGIIFGYSGDLHLPFDESKLHLVCYQAKARAKAAAATSLTCPMVRYRDGRIVKPQHTLIQIDMAATSQYQKGGYVQVSQRIAIPKGNGKNWSGYSKFHTDAVETRGNFIGIRGLKPYQVLDAVDHENIYGSIVPEGPLEGKFGAAARFQYTRLTTGVPRRMEVRLQPFRFRSRIRGNETETVSKPFETVFNRLRMVFSAGLQGRAWGGT
jgi:hypothetical protein